MFKYTLEVIDDTVKLEKENLGELDVDDYTNKISEGKYEGVSLDEPIIQSGMSSAYYITSSADAVYIESEIKKSIIEYIKSRISFYTDALEYWEALLERKE